jgi:membrane protease YdiL (CAAX protease family)
MRIVKATRRDWKWPAIFLLAGLAGAAIAYFYFFHAFPEASIDLRLSRTEIAERGAGWLRLRGLNPAGYRQSVLFDPEDEARTYLEREMGLEAANRLMASQVPVWRWRVRFFRPPQKEEFVVRLTTAGQLTGFRHLIDEKAPGARLGKDEAQRLAEIFLRAQKAIDPAHYWLVSDSLDARPNRHDYTFTWERRNYRLKEATWRVSVTVQGDRIGGYREFLKVPEQWDRDYQRLRSRNELLNMIATAFYLPLLIAGIIVLIRMAQRKRVEWRAAVAIGGLVGALFAVMGVNQLPTVAAQFPTNAPYSTSVAIVVIGAVLAGALIGAFVALLAAAGAPLYSDLVPNRIRLSKLFTLPGLRSKEFFFSTLIGYGMAAMHIGAVVLFYIVARRFGAWAPLEVNYDNALSTYLPWLYPMAVSLLAATSEEFSFRLFAIPLLDRWLKSRWLAIVIPAFVWGFLHSSYPQQPAWIRGVEVGLIGLLAGWVMLRFGILATLVWHYTVDAVMIGLFLLRSDNLGFKISGALVGDVVLIPLLVGVVLYWQHGGFVEDETLTGYRAAAPGVAAEVAAGTPQAAAEPAAEPVPAPAGPRRVRIAIGAGLAGVVLLLLVRPLVLGDFIRYTIGRRQAEVVAVTHLRGSGVNVERFRRVTVREQAASSTRAEYLRERVGLAETNRIYSAGHARLAVWRTRFFRPLEKSEYSVRLAPDGSDPRTYYQQDEQAPGAALSAAEAQARAEAFLKARGVTLDEYNLVQSNPEKRPARNDFSFVWEGKKPLAGEARERVAVDLTGDRLSGPFYSIKIPEDWERNHTRQRLSTLLLPVYIGLWVAVAVVVFAKRVGRATLRWTLYAGVGALGAALVLSAAVVNLPAWEAGYDTSIPWSTEMTREALGAVMGAMGAFVGLLLAAMTADTLLGSRFGRVDLLPASGRERAQYLREALILGACGALGMRGVQLAARALTALIPAPMVAPPAAADIGSSSFCPAGAALFSALNASLWMVLVGGVAAGVVFAWLRRPRAIAAALLATTAFVALPGALSLAAYARDFAYALATVGALTGLVWLLRLNIAGYLVAAVLAALLPATIALARHPAFGSDATACGAVLALAAVGLLLWIHTEESTVGSLNH